MNALLWFLAGVFAMGFVNVAWNQMEEHCSLDDGPLHPRCRWYRTGARVRRSAAGTAYSLPDVTFRVLSWDDAAGDLWVLVRPETVPESGCIGATGCTEPCWVPLSAVKPLHKDEAVAA